MRLAVRLSCMGAVFAFLGGCLGTSAGPSTTMDPGAVAEPPISTRDVLELALVATPQGTVAGFSLRIPPGWVRDGPPGTPWKVLRLAVEPAADGPIDRWGLFTFLDDASRGLSSYVVEDTTRTVGRLAVLQTPVESKPTLQPTRLSFTFFDGDPSVLNFVLGAAAPEATPFRVQLQVEGAGGGEQAGMAASDGAVSARRLDAVGQGEGYSFGSYLDVNVLFVIGSERRMGSVVVAEGGPADTRPAAQVRRLTLSHSFSAPQGWTTSTGAFLADHAVGTWSVNGQARGTNLNARSVIAMANSASLASLLVVGWPAFTMQGDGAGASSTEFKLDYAQAGQVALLLFWKIDFGAGLGTLLNLTAPKRAVAVTGIAGNIPPTLTLELEGSDLIVHGPEGIGRIRNAVQPN